MVGKFVDVFEVGPRDGLQAEAVVLSSAQKLALIEGLIAAGLTKIEVGSFVRAEWIPQLADTDHLCRELTQRYRSKKNRPEFWAFVPNLRGLERALEHPVLDGFGFFIAASNTFCLKNVNRSQEDLLAELEVLLEKSRKAKKKTRVYLSTLVFCPYEGAMAPAKVLRLAKQVLKLRPNEIVLSDTTGDANPVSLDRVLKPLLRVAPASKLALHVHDTRGLALANSWHAYNLGIRRFDSSIGGSGGCPFAPGATGNLATEDLVNLFAGAGLLRGVDLGRLTLVSGKLEVDLNKKLPARMLSVLRGASSS